MTCLHHNALNSRYLDKNQELRVAIIGCGFSGIAAAAELRRKGINNFVIFEAAKGVGGTWWYNTYPGAAVDLESHLYSFRFHEWDWSTTHASAEEIHAYLAETVESIDLEKNLLTEKQVAKIEWSDREQAYNVKTTDNEDHGFFHAVISAVGFLNIPNIPTWAKNTNFQGEIYHTADWPKNASLLNKRVGVVGTGSSSVQIATEAAKSASKLVIFQRSPNWVLPKYRKVYSGIQRKLLNNFIGYKIRRLFLFLRYDLRQINASHARTQGWSNKRRHRAAMKYLQESLSDRPDLQSSVTPNFPFEGKRTVISDTYYETLRKTNVSLVTESLNKIDSTGAVDSAGTHHEIDVLILATGFQASNYLGNLQVIGPDGIELHDVWNGEPEAFLGVMVPRFPNFFMMYGPNTNGIPLISLLHNEANFIALALRRLVKKGRSNVEVSAKITRKFNGWLQRRLSETTWEQVSNYFKTDSGKIVSQWPFTTTLYAILIRLGRIFALKYKGCVGLRPQQKLKSEAETRRYRGC